MQLFTYQEIQEIEQMEDGNDFRMIQCPEYLFTWDKNCLYVNMWVTNNVGIRSMEPEYSFYQFCKRLEIEAEDAENLDQEKIMNMLSVFALYIVDAKNKNTLPDELKFQLH